MKNISIEKMLEIEGLKKDMVPLTDNIDELKYWIYSVKMPFEEIKQALIIYDKSSPKLDEIEFIKNLEIKYKQSRENVVLRIRQVRKIMKHDKILEKTSKTTKKKQIVLK